MKSKETIFVTIQVVQFTVHSSWLVAFLHSHNIMLEEYFSLTEPTGNTEKKYLIIFLNFVISVFSVR